jgi:uncharacterized protein YndB with AHSA1/START domain
MGTAISVSRDIRAPAERVWNLVSDLPRMGEWSPENTGGAWRGGTDGPKVGAKFKGTNARGRRRWRTLVIVTDCQPGCSFGFDVRAGGMGVAHWGYALEATDDGCRVTETFTDTRGRTITFLGSLISGVSDRASHNQAGMETTLANLAAAAEAAPRPT